jgi:hypothetical protein
MAKTVTVTPANPTQAAGKTGVKAVVFGTPTGNNTVGTVHKQLSSQSFDANGTLTLDVDDVGALSAGTAVLVYAENSSESLSGLFSTVVVTTATSLDPTLWSANGNSVSSVPVSVPGGTAASGDSLYIVLGIADTGGTTHNITADSAASNGFTKIVDVLYSGSRGRLYVYEKTLSSTTTTLTNVSLSETSANYVVAVIKARGGRTQPVGLQTAEFAEAFVAPGIQASNDDSTLLRIGFAHNWPRWYDSPPAMTELAEVRGASNLSAVVAWQRVDAGYQQPGSFIPHDTSASGPVTGDEYSAVSIVLDGTGGAPPPTSPKFLFGSHQHGRASGFERLSGGSHFNYSVIRSHNVEYLQRNGQHMGWWVGRSGGINQYDWGFFDDWCDYHKAKGRRLLWNCFGNPTWLARNTTEDAYGLAGGCSYVTQANRPAYRQFVADTVAHLLATHGSDFLVGVEAWNEPIGGETSDNSQFLKASGYDNDWSLSSIQQCIADITKDVYLGVRAVSSTVPVIGFAHAWWGSPIDKIIAAKTTEGEPIWQFCDAFSFHPYGMSDQIDPDNGDGRSLTALKADIIASLPSSQQNKPLWATECAMPELWSTSMASSTWFINLYDSDKAALAQAQYDWVQEFKSGGWQALITYSCDGGYDPAYSNGTWYTGGDHGSGYQFMGISSDDDSGTPQTVIVNAWTSANTDLHSWG